VVEAYSWITSMGAVSYNGGGIRRLVYKNAGGIATPPTLAPTPSSAELPIYSGL